MYPATVPSCILCTLLLYGVLLFSQGWRRHTHNRDYAARDVAMALRPEKHPFHSWLLLILLLCDGRCISSVDAVPSRPCGLSANTYIPRRHLGANVEKAKSVLMQKAGAEFLTSKLPKTRPETQRVPGPPAPAPPGLPGSSLACQKCARNRSLWPFFSVRGTNSEDSSFCVSPMPPSKLGISITSAILACDCS